MDNHCYQIIYGARQSETGGITGISFNVAYK